MSKGRRKIPKRCRLIGHHVWDCRSSRQCDGNHRCIYCGTTRYGRVYAGVAP